MLFEFFAAYALTLIAVIVSAGFLVWLDERERSCKRCFKIAGYAVLFLAAGAFLCVSYQAFRFSRAGAFKAPAQRGASNVQMQFDGMNFGPAMGPGMMNPAMQQHMRQRMQGGPASLPGGEMKDMPAPPTPPSPPPAQIPDVEPPPQDE